MLERKEIVICPNCEGIGQQYAKDEYNRPLVSNGQPVRELCPVCQGEGRVLCVVGYFPLKTNIVEEQPVKEITLKGIFKKKRG